MNPRTFTLVFLLGSLIVLLVAFGLLNRLITEGVVLATERYAVSSHADRESRAFTNWNNNEPPLVPTACAHCHGTPGLVDFLGADGSTPGVVEREAPAGEVITCIACHNPVAHNLKQVVFHSGAAFEPVRTEGICLICHQSRQSTYGIQAILGSLAEDVVTPDLSFINPHYSFAASTQLGAVAHSGYEYPGRSYAGYFAHAAGAETCTDCHNAHRLAVAPQPCAACHTNVVRHDDFRAIRTQRADFDGDGDTTEGIADEIASLHALLLEAIQAYARHVIHKPIVYADRFPYFFIDSNDNGIADADEIDRNNRYDAWTPRLLKAAYNYQFIKKDLGGYVHNARYAIQLLHDSLIDLSSQAGLPVRTLPRP